jgi:hypothetical protein
MTIMTDYSMEKLRETFSDHAAKSEKAEEERVARFKEINPGEPLPEHMTGDFSLPKALASMCEAIIGLQS